MTPSQQAKAFGDAWERLPQPRPQLTLEILDEKTGKQMFFNLGPHPPRLWPEDIELLHKLWLNLTDRGPGYKLHHRDVVRVALRRLETELHSLKPRKSLTKCGRKHPKSRDRKRNPNPRKVCLPGRRIQRPSNRKPSAFSYQQSAER